MASESVLPETVHEGEEAMLLSVRHSTGKVELVSPRKLQKLIDNRKIVQFMRADRWVTVGYDPIREKSSKEYRGPERRA